MEIPATAQPASTATLLPSATVTLTVAPVATRAAPDAVLSGLFQPGPPWPGQGTQGIAQQEAEQLSDYPVFWLGEQVAGYNLQAILRDAATPWIGFAYGTCTESPCTPPIQIQSEPVCATLPESLFGGSIADDLEPVRGEAQLLRLPDGHVRLWTGQVGIRLSVDASLADQVDQLVHQLRAINGPIQPGDPLPPPDFTSCPDRSTPVIGSV